MASISITQSKIKKFSHWAIITLIATSMVTTGCASKYGPQSTKVNHYPQCYSPIEELRKDENTTATSTGTGAAVGALLGALIGGLASGKASGALAGAAAGGAVGAVGGHAYGSSQQRNKDQAAMNKYISQLDGEAAGMDRATAAAKVSVKCYDTAFKLAAASYKAGKMDRMEFADRYAEIKSGLEETSRILNNTSEEMAKKEADYQRVLYDETGQNTAAATPAPSPIQGRQKYRPAKNQASSNSDNVIANKTNQWSSSKQDLDDTKGQVNSRMSELEKTANDLMG